ncbi:MAG: hypothetical protein AAFY65_14555 [Pseudomonadota bacterium]
MANGDFTDEELTAYLDGEASDDVSSRITAALAQGSGGVSDRLEALGAALGPMQAAYGALLNEAPKMPVLPSNAPARGRPRLALVAASVATLVLGFGIGQWNPAAGAVERDWMTYVASYQALYVPETLPKAVPSEAERLAQLGRLGFVLGLDLPLPEVEGLTYARGQVLGFDGVPLIQLAFATEAGTPVALCIIERPEDQDTAIALARREGLEAAAWIDGGYGFLLIGGTDRAMIRDAAEQFAAAL